MPSKISGSWNQPPLCSTDRKVPMARQLVSCLLGRDRLEVALSKPIDRR
jgi:hypothetical protein